LTNPSPSRCRRLSCSERKTANILLHPTFKDFDVEFLKSPDYMLPGYSDHSHQNAVTASASYKRYTPETMHYSGDPKIWEIFDSL
jgi:hypothetical protein